MPDDEARAIHLPTDNLIRASAGGLTLRATEEGQPPILEGHGAVFNRWTRIDSMTEGTFLERVMPGSFTKTLAETTPKILFQHGQDPQIGDKILAPTEEAGEDRTGVFYRGELLDGVPPLLVSGLRAGVYGSSFRFSVVKGRDAIPAKRDADGKYPAYNPEGLPERTIREVKLSEMGPVTWPAYPTADAAVRSLTDRFQLQRLASDPERLEELIEEIAPDPPPEPPPPLESEPIQDPPEGGSSDSETPAEPERSTPPEPAPATPKRVASIPPPTPKEKHVSSLNAEERASRMTELDSAIREVAESYTGALPADVEVTYQTNKQELADLEKDETAYQSRKADLAHLGTRTEATRAEVSWGANPPNVIKRPENIYDMAEVEKRGRSPEERGQMFRDNAMRAIESSSWANPQTDVPATENKIARLLDHADTPDKEFAKRILATGDPVYVRAFNKLVKSHGNAAVLTPEEQRGTAITIGGTGQYLVPFAFDPTVIAIGAHNINPYRANCRVVEVVGASIWHALTSTAAVAVRGVENLVAAEQGPTFAQPSFTPSTVKAQITYSAEAVQDRPDLGSELAVLLGEAKDNEEENTYSIGTGATTMLGVVGMAPASGTSGAFTALTTITGGGATVAIADLYALEMAVPMRWRPDAGWFMARQTIRKFQGFETTSGILFNAIQNFGGGAAYPAVGNPNLTPTGETGLKLLGYPVYEAPSIPVATGGNAAICTLAARHQFVLVDRIGMEVQFIPWIQTAGTIYVAGQQALFAIWRNGGGPMQADAGRVLRYLT